MGNDDARDPDDLLAEASIRSFLFDHILDWKRTADQRAMRERDLSELDDLVDRLGIELPDRPREPEKKLSALEAIQIGELDLMGIWRQAQDRGLLEPGRPFRERLVQRILDRVDHEDLELAHEQLGAEHEDLNEKYYARQIAAHEAAHPRHLSWRKEAAKCHAGRSIWFAAGVIAEGAGKTQRAVSDALSGKPKCCAHLGKIPTDADGYILPSTD